jgi:hypothetical protein
MGGCGIGDFANLELGRDSPQAMEMISGRVRKRQSSFAAMAKIPDCLSGVV